MPKTCKAPTSRVEISKAQISKAQISKAQIFKTILGALAVSVACGAAQFASGHDLTGGQQVALGAAENGINRAPKTDRSAAAVSSTQMRTIALRLDSLADTSVLIRFPVAGNADGQARSRPVSSPPTKAENRKTTVACEPVVSVLTEVAKLLQPGRCVT